MGTPTNSSVRPARASDATGIAAVQATAWRHDFRELVPAAMLVAYPDPAATAAWQRAIEHPAAPTDRVLVALAGEEVVGVLAWCAATDPDSEPGDVEVVEFTVAPTARDHGHGSRLLAAWADLARERFASTGITWIPRDAPGVAFLELAGFAQDGATRELDLHGDGESVVGTIRLTTDLTI